MYVIGMCSECRKVLLCQCVPLYTFLFGGPDIYVKLRYYKYCGFMYKGAGIGGIKMINDTHKEYGVSFDCDVPFRFAFR